MTRERTVITTIEITTIYKEVPTARLSKENIAQLQKHLVKNELDADDVVITRVQEFIP